MEIKNYSDADLLAFTKKLITNKRHSKQLARMII
jgi:hypothetical protein